MIWFIGKLKWQDLGITELDKIADYEFQNKIKVRIVRGEMADNACNKPFELIIFKPEKFPISIGKLTRTELNIKLNELHNEKSLSLTQ